MSIYKIAKIKIVIQIKTEIRANARKNMYLLPSHRCWQKLITLFANVFRTKGRGKVNISPKETLYTLLGAFTKGYVPRNSRLFHLQETSIHLFTFNVSQISCRQFPSWVTKSENIKPDGWLMAAQECIIVDSLTFKPQVESQCSYWILNPNCCQTSNILLGKFLSEFCVHGCGCWWKNSEVYSLIQSDVHFSSSRISKKSLVLSSCHWLKFVPTLLTEI